MSTTTHLGVRWLRILGSLAILLTSLTQASPVRPALAAASLTVRPLTWNVIGLDSNDVTAGPNHFPVGAEVCNTGDAPATNVRSTFTWTTSDPYIDIRPGTSYSYTAAGLTLNSGECTDFYYEVEVTRTAAAYTHARGYVIAVTADGGLTGSTPSPREVYVESLVSQARNEVTTVRLDGVAVPSGGTLVLAVGNTYTIELVGTTATNGYNQIESFISLPNTLFQILSVLSSYSVGSGVDGPYADACGWDNDPASATYRTCIGSDLKAGGNITTTYQIRVISGAGTSQMLNTLIYDYSGSSYHYNSDFTTSARIVDLVDLTRVTIGKSFTPNVTVAGGTVTLTVVLTNTNAVTVSAVSVSDNLPVGMVVANPANATTSGCGTPTYAPSPGDTSISFAQGTIAANSTCVFSASVTVAASPAMGTYTNTTNSLIVGGVETEQTATATLRLTLLPPAIAKDFAPDPAEAPGVARLTFTIANSNAYTLTSVAFTDTLPTSPGIMVVANPPNASSVGCGSPTFSPAAGDGTLTFANGTLAPGGTCVAALDVYVPVAGEYANTTGPVSTVIDGVISQGNVATDTLRAITSHPGLAFAKEIAISASGPWTNSVVVVAPASIYYRLVVTNTGDVPLSSLALQDSALDLSSCALTDPLPAGQSTECIAGPVAAVTTSGTYTNTATAGATYGEVTLTPPPDTASYTVPVFWLYMPCINCSPPPAPPQLDWAVTLGYEDLPLASGQNDYDYNDWVVEVQTQLGLASAADTRLKSLTMTFAPRARGALSDHSFDVILPGRLFPNRGTASVTLYDKNNLLISSYSQVFAGGADQSLTIFPSTAAVYPGELVNTEEGYSVMPAQQWARLVIVFDNPFAFSIDPSQFGAPHGQGLFFDPVLGVAESGDQIHGGDLRTLAVPISSWLWPEEHVRLDRAYPWVVFNTATPPAISFPASWWIVHTSCVYDGTVCTVP